MTSRWAEAARPYLERAPLAALFLGVSSGFTFAMIGATLTTRLAQHGINKSAVTAFALTFLAYNFKFLWAPVVDNGVFYRELSPYGRWVRLEGRYVWMPQVGQGWRPYTDGRWEYTRRYGWTWVSNEPFGWATYHYGRWAYSNRLGWVWVPGTQWAPAWVAWRGSDDHLAWAPLPPDAGPDFALDDGFDEIPGYYSYCVIN